MKKNVLVFPCGSEIGLEIFKSLNLSTHFRLFGASSVDDHGKFVYENYIPNVPNVDDEKFVVRLKEIVEEYSIDFIFPAHDSVVLRLSAEKLKNNLNCKLIAPPFETCDIARSKMKTYKFMQDIIPVPKIYDNYEELRDQDFPIFLKPDIGQGSKGVHKAINISEIKFYKEKDPSLLLLEYLPGKEYTIDCFTNQRGELIFCRGRERRRVLNGISVNSVRVDKKEFLEMATKINKELTLTGAWFFQVKERAGGELVLLEIAPRIAGTMALSRAQGVNLPLLSLFDASGLEVNILENDYLIEIDRALENKYKHNITYSHLYIDFDDLIIINSKVNPMIIALIYQSINKNVKIHLLTRRTENLRDQLNKYRLTDLFDEIILVKIGEKKSSYIKEDDSIFIDDSFSERQEVKLNRGVPVFDAHTIESLME